MYCKVEFEKEKNLHEAKKKKLEKKNRTQTLPLLRLNAQPLLFFIRFSTPPHIMGKFYVKPFENSAVVLSVGQPVRRFMQVHIHISTIGKLKLFQ